MPPLPVSSAQLRWKDSIPRIISVRDLNTISTMLIHLIQQLSDWANNVPRLAGDTVGLIVWSAAEMGVTLICIGIPVCRPLYKRLYRRFRSQVTGSSGYLKQSEQSRDQPGFALRTIGGGVLAKPQANNRKSMSVIKSSNEDSDRQMEVTIGVSERSKTTVVAQGRFESELETDEDSLTSNDYGRSHLESSAESTRRVLGDEEKGTSDNTRQSRDRITVTQTYTVDRN